MNTLALTLALIFLPGIIWARLDAKFGSQTKPSQFELVLNVFVFGLVAYIVTYLLYLIPQVSTRADFNLTAFKINDERAAEILSTTIVDDILVATIVSLVLAPAWLALTHYKIVPRFLQHIKVTNRYGDEDVWNFVLNAADKQTQYVNVRDLKTGTTMSGYVAVFSESSSMRELLLHDVLVYDSATGVLIAEVPRLYFARDPKEITLEFPADSSFTWVDGENRKEPDNG